MNRNTSRSMACAALHGLLAALTAEGGPYTDRIDKAADLIAFVEPDDPSRPAIDGCLRTDPDMRPFRLSKAESWLPRLLIYLARQREYVYDELKGILTVFRFAQKLGVDVFARDRFGTTAFVSALNGQNFDLAVFMHHHAERSMVFLRSDALPVCAVPTDDAELIKGRVDTDSDVESCCSKSDTDNDTDADAVVDTVRTETDLDNNDDEPKSSKPTKSVRLTAADLKKRDCWRRRCRSDYQQRATAGSVSMRMAGIGSSTPLLDLSTESGDDDREINSDAESVPHACRGSPPRSHTRRRKEQHRRMRRLIAASTAADLYRTAFAAYCRRLEPVQIYVRSLIAVRGLADMVLNGYLDLVDCPSLSVKN